MTAPTRTEPLPTFPAVRLAEEHRREQARQRTVFLRAVVDLWRLLVLGDLRGTLRPWALRTTDAVIEHHQRAAVSAARYYSQARALPRTPPRANPADIPSFPRRLAQPAPLPTFAVPSGARRRGDRLAVTPPAPTFQPSPAAAPDRDRVARTLTGAALGRAAEVRRSGVVDLDKIGREALAETSRAASELVLDGARDTVLEAVRADPDAERWARVTDGDPCAWCAMLAARGFIYKSAGSAMAGAFWGGHPGCGCTPMVGFRGDQAALPDLNQEFDKLWAQTASHFSGEEARRAWRRAIDARRAGKDPAEAAFKDTKGQGRPGGRAAAEADAPAPRRRRTRSGADQDTALRTRLSRVEGALAQLESRRAGGEDNLDDLIDFHREEVERLARRVGARTTPDEALVSA